jgi:ribosomal protein S18 acetylase RimI-like enzyme
MSLAIALTPRPTREERNTIGKGLNAYNREAFGRRLRAGERWFLARDAAGAVQAGAKCEEVWGWLYVDWLWVAAPFPQQGWGGRLLTEAEAYARGQRLKGLHLNTWSFQAPDFYRKQGFTCVGQVAEMPPGATRYWFAKPFKEETP